MRLCTTSLIRSRTARAGAEGKSIAFCTAEEKSYLHAIEKTTRQQITVIEDHPFHSAESQNAPVLSVGQAKAAIEKRLHATQAASKAAVTLKSGQQPRSTDDPKKRTSFFNKKKFGFKKKS